MASLGSAQKYRELGDIRRLGHALDAVARDRLRADLADGLARSTRPLREQILRREEAEQKLKYLAGSESAAGVWINDIRPEDAAARLREAVREETIGVRCPWLREQLMNFIQASPDLPPTAAAACLIQTTIMPRVCLH